MGFTLVMVLGVVTWYWIVVFITFMLGIGLMVAHSPKSVEVNTQHVVLHKWLWPADCIPLDTIWSVEVKPNCLVGPVVMIESTQCTSLLGGRQVVCILDA